MIQVRHGVFETNSSSTHSLTICMQSDYNAWARGELYLNAGRCYSSYSVYKDKQFVTKEEAIDILVNNEYPVDEDLSTLYEEDFNNILRDNEIYTFEEYGDDFEWFEDSLTTPNGDTVVAFGYYGYEN